MYDKILLPTDGSKGSEAAVEHAIDLARKYDAELNILYVADIRVDSTSDLWTNMLGELEKIGDKAVSEIAADAEEKGVKTVTEVRKGVPYKEINAYTDENDIDLVVMSTHGRTGIDRVLLGSVTEKVVRTSKVPVMTVGRGKDR